MGKYKNLQDDIFTVFNSVEWKAENINTYPSNFITVDPENEFIRVSIIPNGEGINLKSVSGVIMADIFTSAGSGPNRAYLIADTLDTYLQGKSLTTVSGNVTQFDKSAMSPNGRDPDNKSLFRHNYSIPFNFFGVS